MVGFYPHLSRLKNILRSRSRATAAAAEDEFLQCNNGPGIQHGSRCWLAHGRASIFWQVLEQQKLFLFFCIRNWVSTAPNMGQMGVKDMTDPSESSHPNHPKESQRKIFRGPPGKRGAELAAANS